MAGGGRGSREMREPPFNGGDEVQMHGDDAFDL